MGKSLLLPSEQGPFRAEHLRSGDPYELSHGHAIFCLPTGGRGAKAAQVGGEVLASDPLVEDVGFVRVVRLNGPRRVEIHRRGEAMKLARAGEILEAPGVLANPVPVEALFDPAVGREVTLRNLLQREGYASLDAVRAEGEIAALRESVLTILSTRGLAVGEEVRAALIDCRDPQTLRRWQQQAVTADTAEAILPATDGERA